MTNGIVRYEDSDLLVVNAHCKGIAKTQLRRDEHHEGKEKTALNFNSTEQPFIFALGPMGRQLWSNSPTAGIRRHMFYSGFKMDMTKATVEKAGDVDTDALSAVGNWKEENAVMNTRVKNDFDFRPSLHAVAMCGTYVVLFPMGVVFLRLLERVMWHGVMQGAGTVVVVLGAGIGVWMGGIYNRVSSFGFCWFYWV